MLRIWSENVSSLGPANLRMTLVDCGHFGPTNGSVQTGLDAAFRKFTTFCRIRNIYCSQPPFTEKMVLWLLKRYACMFVSKQWMLKKMREEFQQC